MVKIVRSIAVLLIVLVTVSCNKRESAIKQTTQAFLNCFLKANFDSAAIYCTPELTGAKFDSLKAPMNNLDSVSREILLRKLELFSAEIISIEKKHKDDSVKVTYRIIQKGSKDIINSLIVVKSGENWKIGKFAE